MLFMKYIKLYRDEFLGRAFLLLIEFYMVEKRNIYCHK